MRRSVIRVANARFAAQANLGSQFQERSADTGVESQFVFSDPTLAQCTPSFIRLAGDRSSRLIDCSSFCLAQHRSKQRSPAAKFRVALRTPLIASVISSDTVARNDASGSAQIRRPLASGGSDIARKGNIRMCFPMVRYQGFNGIAAAIVGVLAFVWPDWRC